MFDQKLSVLNIMQLTEDIKKNRQNIERNKNNRLFVVVTCLQKQQQQQTAWAQIANRLLRTKTKQKGKKNKRTTIEFMAS